LHSLLFAAHELPPLVLGAADVPELVVVAVVVVDVVSVVPGAVVAATACGTNSLIVSVAWTCGQP
jgi:hypothetical protein